MKPKFCVAALLLIAATSLVNGQRQRTVAPAGSARTLTIMTEPGAVVWLDEIRRGKTDSSGKLLLARVASGAHNLRVRATGFKEATLPVAPAARGEIKVRLLRTTDQAELTFQQAETARESARDGEARQKAVDLYRQTLRIRLAYPAAHLGLARVLLDLNDTDGALAEIEAARRYRPNYPEASAVEGRIFREMGQTDDAIGSFNRAFARVVVSNPKRTSALVSFMKRRVNTSWPRTSFRLPLTSSLTPNRSSIKCWALLTRKMATIKKPSPLTKTICVLLPTARWRPPSNQSSNN